MSLGLIRNTGWRRAALRLVGFFLLALFSLQLFFGINITAMRWVDVHTTAFQRSEARRILGEQGGLPWRQDWQSYAQISKQLKLAVIASEDSGFVEHEGVDWEAMEKAWSRNEKEQARSAAAQAKQTAKPAPANPKKPGRKPREPKVVGGSTITQQLAKNLFLSGERSLPRKAQELVLTFMIEALLPKERILEIYLNNVEWGEGVFGAEAAAQHYFRKSAAQLSAYEAARLAVMLPAPKRFEKLQGSGYLAARAGTIVARMGDVDLP